VSPEVQQLMGTREHLRRSVLRKTAGVGEVDARRSPVPSGTSLAGLLQHLAFVESKWFVGVVTGKPTTGTRSMVVDATSSVRTLRAAYRNACSIRDSIVAAIGDADAHVAHDGPVRNRRGALLAVIDETARHAGHADIIGEQLDGTTGR